MARFTFDSIFRKNDDGSYSTHQLTRIGGITISPSVRFVPGVLFAGIDFTQYVDRDFEVQIDNGVFVITGIYEQQ